MILSPKQLQNALNSAGRSTLNKMLTQGRTAANRKVREIYNVKAKTLKDYTIIQRATNRSLEGALIIRGRKLPLIVFGARQVKRGTSVKVKKTSGRKIILHAFVTESTRGKLHVWTREGPARLPIQPKFTISVSGMFENQGAAAFENVLKSKMADTFEHELDFYLKRSR